jgi:hypothetical protein
VRFLLQPADLGDLGGALDAARAAHTAGLDGLLLAPGAALPAPLITAATLAPAVGDVLLAAEVALGDRHPVEVAEEVAVTDLACGGRLVVVAVPGDGVGRDDYEEALDLLRTALAARPFRFEGRRWTVPANLEHNVHGVERRVRVTPAPSRPRVEVWTAGAAVGPDPRRALGHLAGAHDGLDALGAAWSAAEAAAGPALIGAPRGRRHAWDGDPVALRAELRDGRAAFGQDWAVVRAAAADAARIGREVRPHVQLDALPAGLEAHWAEALHEPPTVR